MTKTDAFIKLIFFHRDHIVGGTPPPGTSNDTQTKWKPRPVTDKEATTVINAYHSSVREVAELDLSDDLMPLLRSIKEHYESMLKKAQENFSLGILKGSFSLDATHRLNPALDAILNEMPRLRVEYEKKNKQHQDVVRDPGRPKSPTKPIRDKGIRGKSSTDGNQ